MKIFTYIILDKLNLFIRQQINELKSLQINKFNDAIEEQNLFANINIYEKKEKVIDAWDEINEKAVKSIFEENRLNNLYKSIDNIDNLAKELSKDENFNEFNEIQAQLAEEKYKDNEQKQIKQILQKYYEQEHTELTLPVFKDLNKNFNPTTLIHDFILNQKSEYDLFADSHYAFISDFFPINNVDISSLLSAVRKSIQQNEITPAINIYKAWLRYLRDNNQDYYIYDWNNFNDQGQYIKDISNHVKLDEYLQIEDEIITYDELANKQQEENKFNQYVKQILSNGSYKSNFHELQLNYKQNNKTKELYVNK